MRYLFTNEILDAVLSATNGDSNYPVANLQDRFLQKRFQSTGEISQITSLMNTVADINCLVQGHTNATTIYSYLYGQGQFIGQAYTNLVTDPTDLIVWSGAAKNVTDSGRIINGEKLFKVLATAATSYIYDAISTFSTAAKPMLSIIVKKGNVNGATVKLTDVTGSDGVIADFNINFVGQTVSTIIGTVIHENWIDDDTLELFFQPSIAVVITSTYRYYLFPGYDTSTTGDYCYYSQPQVVDNTTTMFPFIEGTHAADVIDETLTMQDKFIIDMEIDPKFAYNSGSFYYFLTWYVGSSSRFIVYYEFSTDTINIYWVDNGTGRYLLSSVFDNGATKTINQKIRLTILVNLASGGQDDSRFICIPLEQGNLSDDTAWSGIPDIINTPFPTLSIGWDGITGNQACSDIIKLLKYDWNGADIGVITSSDDVDTALAGRTILFEFEPDSVLFKESVVHNLNSDTDFIYFDTVKDVKQIVTTIEGPDPVYLGGLAAGEYYQMPDPEEAFSLPLRDNSHYEQSLSGQVLSNYEKPLEALEWTFKGITNEVANEIRSEYIEIGKGTPFYADFFENNRDFYSPLYCFFTAEPGDQKNSRRRDYAVELLEAR